MQIRSSIIQKKDLRNDFNKHEQNLPDLSDKFRKVFEIFCDEIISCLTKKSKLNCDQVKQNYVFLFVEFHLIQYKVIKYEI
ncbi:unnamed protein product [Paramecium octaurelia]|uniref:Uncharacterized protein n=1 Tax=Paramecium octaurelia TaxID=43137 RepID=A0A8S1W5H0_PAROT|nr:unnamed protein product [Paramecium octaurelia]